MHQAGYPKHQIAHTVRTTEEMVDKVLASPPRRKRRDKGDTKEQPNSEPKTVNKYT